MTAKMGLVPFRQPSTLCCCCHLVLHIFCCIVENKPSLSLYKNLFKWRRSRNRPCFIVPDADGLVHGARCYERFANAHVKSGDFGRVKWLSQYFKLASVSLHTTAPFTSAEVLVKVYHANTKLAATGLRYGVHQTLWKLRFLAQTRSSKERLEVRGAVCLLGQIQSHKGRRTLEEHRVLGSKHSGARHGLRAKPANNVA